MKYDEEDRKIAELRRRGAPDHVVRRARMRRGDWGIPVLSLRRFNGYGSAATELRFGHACLGAGFKIHIWMLCNQALCGVFSRHLETGSDPFWTDVPLAERRSICRRCLRCAMLHQTETPFEFADGHGWVQGYPFCVRCGQSSRKIRDNPKLRCALARATASTRLGAQLPLFVPTEEL